MTDIDEMETLDGERIVWFEASNDGNLEEGWCIWPSKPYEYPVLCEYFAPEKFNMSVADARKELLATYSEDEITDEMVEEMMKLEVE